MLFLQNEVVINDNVEAVFDFVSDPTTWVLSGPSLDELRQHPIAVGSSWRFAGEMCHCIALRKPKSFTYQTGRLMVHCDFESLGDALTRWLVRIETSSVLGTKEEEHAETHKKLIATLGRLLARIDHLGSIRLCEVARTTGPRATVLVSTEATIRRPASMVFDVVAGSPGEFWQWMVDRSNPGGLKVSPDWPSEGSWYEWKKPMGWFWDKDAVKVVSVVRDSSILLEEVQRAGIRITTTFTLIPVSQDSTLLRSEYVFGFRNWIFRRKWWPIVSQWMPSEMIRQTANIVSVCEAR